MQLGGTLYAAGNPYREAVGGSAKMLLGHFDIFCTVLDEAKADKAGRQQCGQQHQKHQAGADVHRIGC